jgi:hypothetical protein
MSFSILILKLEEISAMYPTGDRRGGLQVQYNATESLILFSGVSLIPSSGS